MAGENPDSIEDGKLPSQDDFLGKSVGARAAIAFAGPFVNIAFAFILLIFLYIHGNRLTVQGSMAVFRYTVISVDGARKVSGFFRKELDLSLLPVGVYGIMVESPSGVTSIIKFAKK